jgi:hypothetical protein
MTLTPNIWVYIFISHTMIAVRSAETINNNNNIMNHSRTQTLFSNNSLTKGLLSLILCICLWEVSFLVLFQCFLVLISVRKNLKLNTRTLRTGYLWYALKVKFNGRKYKAWTIAGQDSIRKASVAQLSLRFVCTFIVQEFYKYWGHSLSFSWVIPIPFN